MKIGKLQFKQYAAEKPVTVTPTGQFLTISDVLSKPSLALGSMHALKKDLKLKLTLARYEKEPNFKLAIVGIGILTKDEVIEHIKKQTEFGVFALNAEMQYCSDLMSSLSAPKLPTWPKIPKPPIDPLPPWKPVKKCVWIKVKNHALFCENTTDSVTTPFAKYRIINIHPVFATRGFTVVSLEGINDTRANFVPQAKNALTVYLSGIGHGNYTTYTGYMNSSILHVGQYDPSEVKNKVIHFLSCETAGKLGPDTVANGARCYTGYTENFILQWDDPKTPAVDEFKLFAQSDSTFDLMMANGATAQQAFDATVQAFNAAISQVPNTVAATYLTADRDHLKLIGQASTQIQPYRYVKVCFPLTSKQENALVQAGALEG